MNKEKIRIQILDPTGMPTHEIETKYPSDQLDRFLSQNRIVVISDEEPVSFVSEKHRWDPLNQKKKMSEEEIDILYSEYCKDNIEQLKRYGEQHPNRRIKWSKLSREQFIEKLNQNKDEQ